MKNIDVQIKEKSLVAVVGTVGSGKSSLISAILGEMQLVDGNIALHGSLGYCAQQVELVSKELNHFRGLRHFPEIGHRGH